MVEDQDRDKITKVKSKAPPMDIPPQECVVIGPLDPCTIVIFGASGDLTARKLVPALYNLYLHDGLPKPSPSSLLVGEGTVPFQDMVKNMQEGLIIDQLIGAEQGNVLNGDFSGNVLLGYKVEGGEITGRVKDTMVSGNIYQVLRQLEAVGQDVRWVGGFIRTPSLYCPSLSVATKAG